MSDDEKKERQRQAQESLSEHVRTARQTAEQETKAPYQSGAELGGNYTTQEARDRAAHVPPLHERGPAPETEAQRSARWEWERREQDRDMKELHPTEKAWREGYPDYSIDKRTEQGRGQGFKLKELYPRDDAWRRQQLEQGQAKSTQGEKNVTPEQQASVDKALSTTNLSKDIGGASDVSGTPAPQGPPRPAEPSPQVRGRTPDMDRS